MYTKLIGKRMPATILGLALTLAGALGGTPVSHVAASPASAPAHSLTAVDLGTLGGANSKAFGINPRGDIVGQSETANGETHAFLYRDGTMTDLGTLPGGFESVAYGINPRGDVVGESGTRSGDGHAILWTRHK